MNQLSFDQITPGITGEKIMRDTDEWIARNYYVYREMVGTALTYARAGRHISISKLVEDVRYAIRLNGHTDGFKVNNNVRAGLARRMIKEHPILAKAIETRPSKADWA